MITLDRLAIMIILAWIFVHTLSFGKWTWQKKNRLGAVMVYVLAVSTLVLPLYLIFFRE